MKSAVAAGARVIFEPQVLPDGDEMALILDPEGQSLGIYRGRKPK